MSQSRRSSRSTHRPATPSSSSSTTLRQPRWRTLASTSTTATTASTSTSYVFAQPQADVGDLDAKELLSNIGLDAPAPAPASTMDSKDDSTKMEMLKEQLPVKEVTAEEEPVRFGIDDATVVGGGASAAENRMVLTDSPVSDITPSPTTTTTYTSEAHASTPEAATSLVTASPFPSSTANQSNQSLPTLAPPNPTSTSSTTSRKSGPTKEKTGWLGTFSISKGRQASLRRASASSSGEGSGSKIMGVETPGVKVEQIDLPFPTPREREEPTVLPIQHIVEPPTESSSTLLATVAEPSASASTSTLHAPSPSLTPTPVMAIQAQASSSTHSLPLPISSSSRTPSTPTKQHQQIRKPRSWFASSSPISSSPLKGSGSNSPPPVTSRRIAAVAAGMALVTEGDTSSLEEEAGVDRAPGPGMETSSSAKKEDADSKIARESEAARRVEPPPMVHTISVDDVVPELSRDMSAQPESQSTSSPSLGALSPPIVGAVPPTSRFIFGIPLLRGRAPGSGSRSVSRERSTGEGQSKIAEVKEDADVKKEREVGKDYVTEAGTTTTVASVTAPAPDGDNNLAAVAIGRDAARVDDKEESSTKHDIQPPTISQLNVIESPTNESITALSNNPASTSWWGLIGWSNPTTTATSSSVSNPTETTTVLDERHSFNDQSERLVIGGAGSTNTHFTASEHASVKADVELSDKNKAKSPPVAEDGAPRAVVQDPRIALAVDHQGEKPKDEGDNQVSATSSMWYSPWAWYPYTSPTSHVEPSRAESISGKDKEEEPKRPVDIEGGLDGTDGAAGQGDIQAESRMENETVSREPQHSPEPPEVNPIKSTIESNRSGWASFFTSRALVVKTLGYTSSGSSIKDVKRDEDGNEIMDLDESEDEEPIAPRGRSGEMSIPKTTEAARTVEDARPGVDTSDGNAPASADDRSARGKHTTAPPLTISEGIRRETVQSNLANKVASSSKTSKPSSRSSTPISPPAPKRTSSPTPSAKKAASPSPLNLVLPTWQDTFHTPPRNYIPPRSMPSERDSGVTGKLYGKTMKFVSGILFAKDESGGGSRKGKEKEATLRQERPLPEKFRNYGLELPRALHVVEEAERFSRAGSTDSSKRVMGSISSSEEAAEVEGMGDILKGCRRVVVVGVHGWFPGAMMRTVLGEPTGTSGKFVNMMEQAIEEFATAHGVQFEKITKIPLEGEGTIGHRVEKLYSSLKSNQEWMDDLHAADAIFIATHSQGSVVSTHLLDCLIRDRHIRTVGNSVVVGGAESFPSAAGSSILPAPKPQRVCCLAQCGIHLGPLRYLSSSSLLQPYIQYFESTAARELFEFQNTNSDVSKSYVTALENVLANGVKMVYVASLNDQVVPIYSGLFTAASHPLILRALYIDGDAYHSSDFLSNLLVLMLRILNTNISDSGLLAHLSEATAGSLNGVGHSTSYEELATYSLAVKYLFLTNDGLADHSKLVVEPFNAMLEQNDYEIPWSLRDIIADERVAHFFGREIIELRDAFREWHPKTAILRDLKRKLQPIQRLPASFSLHTSTSKL